MPQDWNVVLGQFALAVIGLCTSILAALTLRWTRRTHTVVKQTPLGCNCISREKRVEQLSAVTTEPIAVLRLPTLTIDANGHGLHMHVRLTTGALLVSGHRRTLTPQQLQSPRE